MLKVMTKRHPHQPRFTLDKSFSDNEINQAFDYAEKLEDVYWAVQIKSNNGISNTWYELRTRYNSKASTH